ncbi:MAG: phosphate/phosphite/phosphonate ABC transporter substrate-binding protein [Bacteroidetes bacterium]|nr:MAG: phosphate/phosphite/phosphonate ABC transporter substrate-binding protein [Bacteroidota bacterium]
MTGIIQMKTLFYTLFILLLLNSCVLEEIPKVDLSERTKIELPSVDDDPQQLKVAISAMISPHKTYELYEFLLEYVSINLNKPIKLIQRKTYAEINNLLKQGVLDFAFICTGAYLRAKEEFPIELLVVPIVNGEPYYQAYVIVKKDSEIYSIDDLEGRSFAFTDPLSNTGHDYIINLVKKMNRSEDDYFGRTVYTYGHDNSIQSVSSGFVDGATVDGLVFEFLRNESPETVKNLRIIKKSEKFGIPPFVVRPTLTDSLKKEIRSVFLNMHKNSIGKQLLRTLMIDRFEEGSESYYKK